MTKDEAARTAGERLEAIEAWSRRTFLAAAAGAAILAAIGAGLGLVGWGYLRLRRAVAEASARLEGPRPGIAPSGRPASPPWGDRQRGR